MLFELNSNIGAQKPNMTTSMPFNSLVYYGPGVISVAVVGGVVLDVPVFIGPINEITHFASGA